MPDTSNSVATGTKDLEGWAGRCFAHRDLWFRWLLIGRSDWEAVCLHRLHNGLTQVTCLQPVRFFFACLFVFLWYSFSSWHFPKLLWLRKIVKASPAERTLESGHSRSWAAWQYQEMSRVWMLVSLCICKIDYICTILYIDIGSANLCQDLSRIVCTDGLRRTVSGPRRIVSEEIC